MIRFGDFTLKSGRISPYFFNAGLFNTGAALASLGSYYATVIQESKVEFETLFGPAYKGIPLVSASAMALATEFNIDKPYCFNRKQAKDHGEGGVLVGAELKGRVLIIDDVITAGTAIRESMQIIESAAATLAGVVVLMDRQERGQGEGSAISEIEQNYGVAVLSIITLDNIIEYVELDASLQQHLPAIQQYRKSYGI